MTINQHYSVSYAFFRNVQSRRRIDSSSIIAHPVNSYSPTWERSLKCYQLCQELDIYILCQELDIYVYICICMYKYIYDALDHRYGFSISVQPGIDCTTFQFLFMKSLKRKCFFYNFQSWQVCDWLAKWMIMLRFMDLTWPRVFAMFQELKPCCMRSQSHGRLWPMLKLKFGNCWLTSRCCGSSCKKFNSGFNSNFRVFNSNSIFNSTNFNSNSGTELSCNSNSGTELTQTLPPNRERSPNVLWRL